MQGWQKNLLTRVVTLVDIAGARSGGGGGGSGARARAQGTPTL